MTTGGSDIIQYTLRVSRDKEHLITSLLLDAQNYGANVSCITETPWPVDRLDILERSEILSKLGNDCTMKREEIEDAINEYLSDFKGKNAFYDMANFNAIVNELTNFFFIGVENIMMPKKSYRIIPLNKMKLAMSLSQIYDKIFKGRVLCKEYLTYCAKLFECFKNDAKSHDSKTDYLKDWWLYKYMKKEKSKNVPG